MWDLCHVYCMFMDTHTHTHTFISPVACLLPVDVLSCGLRSSISTAVLYAIAATCACFCFFVCLSVCFFSACLLIGPPGGAKAGFPTETVYCLQFCFYKCSSWLSVFSFYFCSVFSSLLFLFPCPLVRFSTITC